MVREGKGWREKGSKGKGKGREGEGERRGMREGTKERARKLVPPLFG